MNKDRWLTVLQEACGIPIHVIGPDLPIDGEDPLLSIALLCADRYVKQEDNVSIFHIGELTVGIVSANDCSFIFGPVSFHALSRKQGDILNRMLANQPENRTESPLLWSALIPRASTAKLKSCMTLLMAERNMAVPDAIPVADVSEQSMPTKKRFTMQSIENLYNPRNEEILLDFVASGNLDGIRSLMKGTQDAIEKIGDYGDITQSIKYTLVMLVSVLSYTLVEKGMDRRQVAYIRGYYMSFVKNIIPTEELIGVMNAMCLDFCSRCAQLNESSAKKGLVKKVELYIINHVNEPLTTNSIAEAMNYDRSYLSRRFHAEAGYTLYECICRAKLQEASQLLTYTTMSISDIGLALSFSSSAHFVTFFKRHTGLTPLAFRNEI